MQPTGMTVGSSFQCEIATVAVPGIMLAQRVIAEGDERALLPAEEGAFAASVVKVRRASGAARIVARGLLSQMGQAQCAIPKGEAGMPIWPNGIVGSLAHDSQIAVAAIARQRDFLSVGIDVEPAEALDSDLLDIVASAAEQRQIQAYAHLGRVLFAVKEAVYKTVYPLSRTFLDHHDVEVDFAAGLAQVRDGRSVCFRYGVASHIVALAFISAPR